MYSSICIKVTSSSHRLSGEMVDSVKSYNLWAEEVILVVSQPPWDPCR